MHGDLRAPRPRAVWFGAGDGPARAAALIAGACACWGGPALAGQDGTLQGDHPPFTHFPTGVQAYPQNFAIEQDNRHFVYIGNSDGVIIYDGEQWQLVELPNRQLVRSLRHDGNGRIYVGGYDQFGYLDNDPAGRARFHDLTALFRAQLGQRHFGDIWDILVASEGVFFRALRHLFLYEPASGQVRLWEHAGRFGAITTHEGAPIVQFRGEGLRRYGHGEWHPVAGSSALSTQVNTVLPLPAGGLLVGGGQPGWQVFDGADVRPREMPPGFPPAGSIVAGAVTADGTFAMSSQHGEVYFYEPSRSRYRSVRVDNGYLSDVVAGAGGGVLTVSDRGFYSIAWPSEWTTINGSSGLNGSVVRIIEHGGDWYALGSSGVFRSAGGAPPFTALDWTTNEAWDLLFLPDGSALLAESYVLMQIDADGARPLSDDSMYPRVLRASRFNPDTVYVGTENGLAVLRRGNGAWRLEHGPSLDGVGINSMAETAQHEVWAGSDRDGILRFFFPDGSGGAGTQAQVTHFNAGIAHGDGAEAWVATGPAGELFASSGAGLFQWNGERFIAAALPGIAALRRDGELLRLAWSDDGSAWAFSDYRVFALAGNRWIEKDTGGVLRGAFQGIAFDGSRAVFGASAAIMILDTRNQQADVAPPPLSLTGVEFESRSGARESLPLARAPLLNERHGWLHARFAMPDLNRAHAVRYQTRLLPLETGFTDWAESNHVSYFNLGAGEYDLLARARDSRGNVAERRLLRFSVPAAWHETPAGRMALVLLLLLCFAAAAQAWSRHRSRALAAANERLRLMVTERTRELESANRQLDSMAHLDSLTAIPNRRRLEAYLQEVWQQCAERSRDLAIAIVDVDHFKQYNDRHGHLEGDNLLRKLAGALSRNLRRSEDLVARYGGEEFLLVFPGADQSVAMDVSETARQRIADSDLGVTISIGVAVALPQKAGDVRVLLAAADRALYAAKENGRNRVVLA